MSGCRIGRVTWKGPQVVNLPQPSKDSVGAMNAGLGLVRQAREGKICACLVVALGEGGFTDVVFDEMNDGYYLLGLMERARQTIVNHLREREKSAS